MMMHHFHFLFGKDTEILNTTSRKNMEVFEEESGRVSEMFTTVITRHGKKIEGVQ